MKIVRWVLVLPAAIVAYFVGYKFFMWANNEFVGLSFLMRLMSIIGCGFSAACFVGLGTITAPTYRKITSIVLATIGSMLSVWATFVMLSSDDTDWWGVFQNVANVVGCIVGAFYVAEEYPDN